MRIKKSLLFFLFPILAACSANTDKIEIPSPNKNIRVEITKNEQNLLQYVVYSNDVMVITPSNIGLELKQADFITNIDIESVSKVKKISDQYEMITGKRSHCSYEGNQRIIRFSEINGINLSLEFRVSNDGVGFRYLLDGKDSSLQHVLKEATSFHMAPSSKAWLHPHHKAQSGWQHTNPSYEAHYEMDIDVGTPSPFEQGWSFPALFQSAGNWVLISETDMVRTYCGSHLAHLSPEGEYSIAFPQAPERMGPGQALYPEAKLPFTSPWRTINIGESLGDIVESTLSTDLSSPSKIRETSFVNPGKASWSWIILKDDSTIFSVQKKYIDFAAEMNWKYCLIDALWDTKIGYEKLRELAKYAKTKNVGLLVWYNSNGTWNTAPQTPKNKVTDPEVREKEFALLEEMGIKGLKIDFFGGDGQSFMNYYQDLMEDAARHNLMINFHGTTIPRGWTRTYPNLVTLEAVRGFEFITFNQEDANLEPSHASILPFTRNVIGPMDFTPINFSGIPKQNRITSLGFELALSVIFESGVQHIAETPWGMTEQPEYVIDYMRNFPTAWDDIKYIDGYPGKYIILARKFENKWYIGGINGDTTDINVKLDFSVLNDDLLSGVLITDGDNPNDFSKVELKGTKHEISLKKHGGFIVVTQSDM